MWNSIATTLRNLRQEAAVFAHAEIAVTSIEYALIAALIAIVIVASVTNVGTAVLGLFQLVAAKVAAAI